MNEPLSLSDDAMTMVMRFVQPLAPPDRVAFMHALAQLLNQEPVQPPGDGTVHRHVRQLLATGLYHRGETLAVGAPVARHSYGGKQKAG
jgi:hypothetical protein